MTLFRLRNTNCVKLDAARSSFPSLWPSFVIGIIGFVFHNFPEERVANKFFTALVSKDFNQAYGIWIADPTGSSIPISTRSIRSTTFIATGGRVADWGPMKSFHIDTATRPRDRNSGISNGVVVVVTINERKEPAALFVNRKIKSISFSPFQVVQ